MASAKLLLHKNFTNKDGRHPIKIQVYECGIQRPFSTKINATEDEYKKANSAGAKKKLVQKLRDDMDAAKSKAVAVIDKLGPAFTFEMFKKMYYSTIDYVTKGSLITLDTLYFEQMKQLEKNNQFKYKTSYSSSLRSLLKYGGDKLTLQDIDVDFLKSYQIAMLGEGKSISTIFTYLRPLRAIYNIAIDDKLISNDNFPFAKGYSIGSSHSARAALQQTEIKSFWDYIPTNDAQSKAKDYWFFSFYGFGIAPVDMAKLTHKNLKSDHIEFSRSKTSKSTSEIKIVKAPLNDDMVAILSRIGNTTPKPYLFPILSSKLTPKEQTETIDNWKRQTNKILNRIGKKLNTNKPINLYSARHSFADTMGSHDVSYKIVSDFLGQNTITMALNYMGNARLEKAKEFAALIPLFKNS